MHRLFVALRPPPAARQHLLASMHGIAGARWQSDEQLHLTLAFIGEVDRTVANDIASALLSVTSPAPSIALKGLGSFDRKGQPHSIWIGCEPDAALSSLQLRIMRALRLAGASPEDRAFRPHVTLARLGRGAGAIAPFFTSCGGLSIAPFVADAFLLYESMLGPGGASYLAVHRYSLDAWSTPA